MEVFKSVKGICFHQAFVLYSSKSVPIRKKNRKPETTVKTFHNVQGGKLDIFPRILDWNNWTQWLSFSVRLLLYSITLLSFWTTGNQQTVTKRFRWNSFIDDFIFKGKRNFNVLLNMHIFDLQVQKIGSYFQFKK